VFLFLASPWIREVSGANGPAISSTAASIYLGSLLPYFFVVDVDTIGLVVARVDSPTTPRDFAFFGSLRDLEGLSNTLYVVAPWTMNVSGRANFTDLWIAPASSNSVFGSLTVNLV